MKTDQMSLPPSPSNVHKFPNHKKFDLKNCQQIKTFYADELMIIWTVKNVKYVY
jgi:hypothetical protein